MKRKLFISFVSTLLCIGLMFNLTVVGFAESKKTEYPFIFVHGMCGWGETSPQEKTSPYWGTQPENNVITYLRAQGYTVYNPPVGGYSSAWDRACELYAQLTGYNR